MFDKLRKRFTVTPWQSTLYVLAFAQLITAVGFSSIFPFLPLYVEDLGSTTHLGVEVLSGMVFSAQGLTMMLASPIWGALADRYGRKLMVQRSLFGGAVLLLVMAFARSAEDLVLLRAIQGLITGTVAANSAMVASIAPRERSGYAMGVLGLSLGAGVAAGPLLGGALADALGYQAAFFGTAALLFLAGLLVLFVVKEEFDPKDSERITAKRMLADWRHVLGEPGVLATYGMRFMTTLGRMMVVPIAPLFIQTLLLSTTRINTFVGLVTGVSAGATTLSSVYLGKLGDQIGNRRVLIGGIVGAGVLFLPQSLVTAGWQLLVLQALTGVAIGGILPSISALLSKYTQPGEEGSTYGLDNSINAAGRAAAPLIGGSIAVGLGLRAAYAATGVTLLIAAILAVRFLPRARGVETI